LDDSIRACLKLLFVYVVAGKGRWWWWKHHAKMDGGQPPPAKKGVEGRHSSCHASLFPCSRRGHPPDHDAAGPCLGCKGVLRMRVWWLGKLPAGLYIVVIDCPSHTSRSSDSSLLFLLPHPSTPHHRVMAEELRSVQVFGRKVRVSGKLCLRWEGMGEWGGRCLECDWREGGDEAWRAAGPGGGRGYYCCSGRSSLTGACVMAEPSPLLPLRAWRRWLAVGVA